ncbi:isopenicillin N synthase-like dioxygenase [Rhizobium sp. SG_E_25_P2]|uniref:isopenicillin N synthase family dioxygenase n=1 Tax=Rhizobium sp. SG_E_25_P2 TaxID=2879942 RepID=UPI002472F0E9|nr:2-oxoglutarate and iron-dependent oxygenase domain-containing protein [Rhizobium sp. SG_E_25_P2]MDH6267524.1 isopenicillin N synthase-like dioxygenase [Rhizobium sp. SG_E_25_P2]
MRSPTEFDAVPVVDVSGLFSDDPARQAKVAEELGAAARDVGFLYVTGHNVPQHLYDGVLAAAKGFFAQPMETKMASYIGKSRNHRGYVPEGEEGFGSGPKDKKEAFDLSIDLPDDPDYLAGNPMLGPNQWPDFPGFSEAVKDYYDATFAFGRVLMRGFAMALGEPADVFDGFLVKPPSQLRLIHYPFNEEAEDRMGFGAHTDFECFTLLRSTAPGLEVMNGAGQWIDSPPLDGAYTVNIGDMLELMTNGEFVATSHRVRKVKEERYSFPLFFNLDYHAEVKPLPRFVRAGETPRPALLAGEHLYAQTIKAFAYLKERLARGEIQMPGYADEAAATFGREAKTAQG